LVFELEQCVKVLEMTTHFSKDTLLLTSCRNTENPLLWLIVSNVTGIVLDELILHRIIVDCYVALSRAYLIFLSHATYMKDNTKSKAIQVR
jgi:hypothetical protein